MPLASRCGNHVIIPRKHTAEHVQALVLIFMGLDLGRDKDEILLRVDKGAHAHRGEVVAEDLRLLLILGNTKGSVGGIPTGDEMILALWTPDTPIAAGTGYVLHGSFSALGCFLSLWMTYLKISWS